MKKPGRNDPCPCGSGKKFKKCCESVMIGKKFMASKLDQVSSLQGKVTGLTSFFKTNVATPNSEESKKSFQATSPPSKRENT